MLGKSSGNGVGGASGEKSSKKSPSDSVCGDSTKELSSLLSSSDIGAPIEGVSSFALSVIVSVYGTDVFLY